MKSAAAYDPGTTINALSQGRVAEAVASAEASARGGNSDACFQLGCWKLMGRPVPLDLEGARALLSEAAEHGNMPARHIGIALMAAGVGGPRDWTGALERLRALAVNDQHAAAQIALLDAMDIDEQGDARNVAEREQLSDKPDSWVLRGLLTPQECEHLARISAMHLRPSQVEDSRTGQGVVHVARDSDGGTLGPPQEDMVVQAILLRLAAATATPVENGESLNILRYRHGQQYRPHLDVLPSQANRRRLSTVLYLNDNYEGGETQFVRSGLSFKGRAGDALLFSNLTADGRPDPASLHAGLPVRAGVKWIAMRWIRENPYSPFAAD